MLSLRRELIPILIFAAKTNEQETLKMPHNTKQLICHWYLDGFKPDNEYYHDVIPHFTAQELEKINELLARQYNPSTKFTRKEKAFVLYVLTVALWTSKTGEADDDED